MLAPRHFLPALLFASCTVASAQGPAPSLCGPPPGGAICVSGPWFEFGRVEVTMQSGATSGRYTLQVPAGGDIYGRFELTASGEKFAAEVLAMTSVDTVAARSSPDFNGDPVNLLNAPMLIAQLTASLLQVALPEGPATIGERQAVKHDEPNRPLATATPASRAVYGPPWSLSGDVRRSGKESVAFALTLRYHAVGQGGVTDRAQAPPLKLMGTLTYPAKRARLPDSFDLAGWRIVRQGIPIEGKATLGELRKAPR